MEVEVELEVKTMAPPGRGSGEKINKSDMHKFKELGGIDNWRRNLDDTHIGEPLEIDNKKWASVTHYYQGSKYMSKVKNRRKLWKN